MGVGMLAVPYVIEAAGLLPAFGYFVVLGAITLFINLAYAELILRTDERHRLVGYVRKYLGRLAARVVTISNTFGVWGALMAYIIVGGNVFFLAFRQFGGNPELYQFGFFILMAMLVVRGVKKMAGAEFWLTLIKLGMLAGFIVVFSSFIQTFHYSLVEVGKVFLPYGVILFAIGGSAAIPEMSAVLGNERRRLPSAIFVGTILSIIGVALWGFIVVGITGQATTENAITGLLQHFGPTVAWIGSIFELFLVATPFLVLGENLAEQFQYDLKVRQKWLAFFLALGVPIIILLFIHPSLLKIIGLTGAVFGAVDSTLFIAAYFKMKTKTMPRPELNIRLGRLWGALAFVIFILGAVYQIYFTFVKR